MILFISSYAGQNYNVTQYYHLFVFPNKSTNWVIIFFHFILANSTNIWLTWNIKYKNVDKYGPTAFTWGQLENKWSRYQSLNCVWKSKRLKSQRHLPRDNKFNDHIQNNLTTFQFYQYIITANYILTWNHLLATIHQYVIYILCKLVKIDYLTFRAADSQTISAYITRIPRTVKWMYSLRMIWALVRHSD